MFDEKRDSPSIRNVRRAGLAICGPQGEARVEMPM